MFCESKMEMEEIAKWAYIIFIIIAIIAGIAVGIMASGAHPDGFNDTSIADTNGYVILIMLILGIIIGLTSITTKEVTPFLIATIALMVLTTTAMSSWMIRIRGAISNVPIAMATDTAIPAMRPTRAQMTTVRTFSILDKKIRTATG